MINETQSSTLSSFKLYLIENNYSKVSVKVLAPLPISKIVLKYPSKSI